MGQLGFSQMFSLNSANSVTKIFFIKRAQTCHLLMLKEHHLDTYERIFKLSPIHASVIYQILLIR